MKGGNMKSFCDSVFRLEFATASSGSWARPLLSPGTAGWHQEASTQHHNTPAILQRYWVSASFKIRMWQCHCGMGKLNKMQKFSAKNPRMSYQLSPSCKSLLCVGHVQCVCQPWRASKLSKQNRWCDGGENCLKPHMRYRMKYLVLLWTLTLGLGLHAEQALSTTLVIFSQNSKQCRFE